MQNLTRKMKNQNFNYSIAKKRWRCLADILRLKNGAKECNEYSLGDIGVDTAENEPLEVGGKFI